MAVDSSSAMHMQTVESLFDSLAPPDTDETVREYVCSLLEEADPEDDDAGDLISTLQALLGGDEDADDSSSDMQQELARALVHRWMEQKAKASTTTNIRPADNTMQPLSLAFGETSLLDRTQSPPSERKHAQTDSSLSPTARRSNTKKKNGSVRKTRQQRKEEKKNRRAAKGKQTNQQEDGDTSDSSAASPPPNTASDSNSNWADKDDDDFATAWNECKEQGVEWGGRGRGGRGVQAGSNSIRSNIHLANVTVSVPGGGLELLDNANIDLARGHRYGLVGRNGCGKSTLMKRLAQKNIPGLPQDLNILLVQQEMEGSETQTALGVLLKADTHRLHLIREQEDLEHKLEETDDNNVALLKDIAIRLGEVSEELDAMNADKVEAKATDVLKGLQFTNEMIHSPTENLSGGWRVRLALARALLLPSDILLLDECSNHLDIWGVQWLTKYLTQANEAHKIVVVVSHDRAFLDSICTDIMVIEHGKLKTFPGSWSDYELQQEEKMAHKKQMVDANEKQKAKAQQFIQKQQAMSNKKSVDPNKQRQAKMMKDKKLDRIGNYREDGKKYKNFSLAKMDMDYVRLAEKVTIEADEPVVRMRFPGPVWPPAVAPGSPLIQTENLYFGYRDPHQSKDEASFLLKDLTLNINRGSKIALVGRNGSGKSTLLKLLTGDIQIPNKEKYVHKGTIGHSTLRIGHMTQYSVEELNEFADMTVVEYAEAKLRQGMASGEVISGASGNVRQYLGSFGLGGIHAHRTIAKLSGGERMRLCFATVFAEEPHILVLDESTNHVDVETLDSMATALNTYQGAVVMVSHNQSFLSGFCRELWVVEDNGHVTVNYDDTESFDELFSDYRNAVLSDIGGTTLTTRRKKKANLARKAKQQRAGATQKTALL